MFSEVMSVVQSVNTEYCCQFLYHVLIFSSDYKKKHIKAPLKLPSEQIQRDQDAESRF